MNRRFTALVVATLLMVGCASTGESKAPPSPPTAASADVEQRIAELRSFRPDPSLSGSQCGDLSVSNGSVQLDASESSLTRAVQAAQPVPATALHLVVRFGSGFPSFTCTDLDSEVREATVGEEWAASATSASFTVVESKRCSSATLQLVDVIARAPDGQLVELGDIAITNTAWQWWHPFECHLLDDPPAP